MKAAPLLIAFTLLLTLGLRAQRVELAPLSVRVSSFIEDVRTVRAANPKMLDTELADAANKLLDKQGLNHTLSLDHATCARVLDAKQKQNDPTAAVRLSGTLKSVGGERARLALPEAKFSSSGCGGCFLDIPLLQIPRTEFITVLLGRNIGFELPANVSPAQAVLLDAKDLSVPKRTWSLPERLIPIGVSHDENVIYVAFKEPDLKDLSLAIFTEGTFQVATRTEAEEGGKGENVQSGSAKQRIKFIRWGKTFIVEFSAPCAN